VDDTGTTVEDVTVADQQSRTAGRT